MPATKASSEAAMFPGMIEVKARIVAAVFVPNPLPVVMNVRCFRMTFPVMEVRLGSLMFIVSRGRPVAGDKSVAYIACACVFVLGECR